MAEKPKGHTKRLSFHGMDRYLACSSQEVKYILKHLGNIVVAMVKCELKAITCLQGICRHLDELYQK